MTIMLKKIFCAAILSAVILFVGNAKVSAQDVWIYSISDYDYYVMTETFVNHTSGRDSRAFEVDVKYLDRYDLSSVRTAHWSFRESDGVAYHTINNAQPYVPIHKGDLSEKLWTFCLKFFDIDQQIGHDD